MLPQYIGDQSCWQKRFNPDTHQEYVHDLGNLTLTLGNPSLGNKPFRDKKGKFFGDVQAGYHYAKDLSFCRSESLQNRTTGPQRP